MRVQPTKIILINSANCHYAELDCSESLHLVASNNLGKTSIINTLQFLYIDNQKSIDLGDYSQDESWKHYFPTLGSYVLFELNTLTGKKVFGLAATGLGSQPEKFLLNESYQVEDFIEKSDDCFIPRKPEALFPHLGAKLIKRKLESKDHRQLLRPFHQKNNSEGLGLVGDTRNYRLFKQLFRQLLQLKGITIKDLKAQIEQVNQRVMEKDQVINVQREFNEPYNDIQKRQGELQRLQSNRINIEDLLFLHEQQIKQQGRLASYFIKSSSSFAKEDKQLNADKSLHEESRHCYKEEKLPEISLLKKEKQSQSDEKNQQLGVTNEHIGQYEILEKECLQIVVSLEEEKKKNLEGEAADLQEQRFNAKDEDLNQLQQSLNFKQEDLLRKQKQLNGIASTLFAHLKPLLNDDELRQLYQLSNPELWSLFKNDGFQVQDDQALKSFLQTCIKQVNGTMCTLPGLTLDLSSIATNTLYEMGDPDFLTEKISSLQQEIQKLESKITAVREQESIKLKLTETQEAIKQVEILLERYQQWEQGKEQYKKWVEQRVEYTQSIEKCKSDIENLDGQKEEFIVKINQCNDTIKQLKDAIEVLTNQKRWIERNPPDTNWEPIEVNYDTSSFDELFEQYKSQYEGVQKKSSDIKEKLERLRSTFRQIIGLHDYQALQFLQQELETVPEQEKSINDEWKRIFTSFAAHCRGMIDSVDALDSYLADLNRLLGKEQISNLQSIKVTLETNPWYRHILKIKEWKEHDLPLFGGVDQTEVDALLKAVKPLLDKVKVSIADLYDLKLIVVDTRGNEKHYASLQLESNGTSITAKTIIYISMINEAMKGKQSLGDSIRIPFYVDEIDSLDDANAENIHNIALKLGLIPVFASPKGSGICKRLYQLDNNTSGKLIIRRKDDKSGQLLLVKPTFERIS